MKRHHIYPSLTVLPLLVLSSFSSAGTVLSDSASTHDNLVNTTAYIPSQCYTITEDTSGKKYNPCYVCHTRQVEPNYTADQDLQLEYSFPEMARSNPWKNLFEDRTAAIAKISDTEILSYIRTNNYLDDKGSIPLAQRLSKLPPEWDYNKNGKWDGYQPDCYFNFDPNGFDQNPEGQFTGWRAFGYYPMPATFWPTNGSADDVMIRLPVHFQVDINGRYSTTIYTINLAIVESIITKRDVLIPQIDENTVGVDLNQNGSLDLADRIAFHWPTGDNMQMSYVGQAGEKLRVGKIHLAAGLFPVGTEFLHSVRYLDLNKENTVTLAPRMKELRYMKKRSWQSYAQLEEAALSEIKERDDFPDRISQFIGNSEQGVNNGSGWILQGFIEDTHGSLRPQSFEETVYCVGCHGGIGATTDSTFSFPRKIVNNSNNNGWFHWDDTYLANLPEPKTELHKSGVFYEYSYYLMYNGSGNEFRNNPEVKDRFTNKDGSLNMQEMLTLQHDIGRLLLPSSQRALELNKAYKTIVDDQDYRDGRDVNITPVETVHKSVKPDQSTGLDVSTSPVNFGARFGELTTGNDKIPVITDKTRQSLVKGQSMSGPNGRKYSTSWDGFIHKGTYSSPIKEAQMVFPERLTLPTRPIIPTQGNPSCLVCHRMPKNDNTIEALHIGGQKVLTSTGNNHSAQFSPDGQIVSFVSNRNGQDQIFLMDSDGRNQRAISDSSLKCRWPSWKSDGRDLLYVGFDPHTKRYSIKSYNMKEGAAKTLVSQDQKLDRPIYHPTEDVIAYAALAGDNWDLWLRYGDGKKQRLTTAKDMESNPLWSPDGRNLAFKVAPVGGEYGLTGQNFFTFEAGLSQPFLHIWDGPESVQMNGWSPDGKQIAYTAEIISPSSGEERVSYKALISTIELNGEFAEVLNTKNISQQFTLGDRGPLFSPDGSSVLFWGWGTNFSAGIWLYECRTGKTEQLSAMTDAMYPVWSPNGDVIIFEAMVGENRQLQQISLSNIRANREQKLAAH